MLAIKRAPIAVRPVAVAKPQRVLVVKAQAQRKESVATIAKPVVMTAVANIIMALPAAAEAG